MGFKINFDEENVSTGFELVKEGKYEVTIVNAKAEEFQGNHNIGFDVEIRSDFAQEHQGAKILYNTIYLSSSNPEYAESTQKKLNSFLVACGYTGKTQLDLNEVVNNIIGKSVYAYVKHRPDKNDATRVYPYVSFVAESKLNAPEPTGPAINVGDDDLPF